MVTYLQGITTTNGHGESSISSHFLLLLLGNPKHSHWWDAQNIEKGWLIIAYEEKRHYIV